MTIAPALVTAESLQMDGGLRESALDKIGSLDPIESDDDDTPRMVWPTTAED